MNISDYNQTDKRKAQWLGSILGDAFVLGGHWIYDLKKLRTNFPVYDTLQQPLNDTFHKNKNLGDQTHYGDQARHLWQFMQEHEGRYEPTQYRQAWLTFLSDYKGYIDSASRDTRSALKRDKPYGSSSDELGGTARLAAVYYWLDQPEEALDAAVDQSRMTHDNPKATAITALFAHALQRLLLETTDEKTAMQALQEAKQILALEKDYEVSLIERSFDSANRLTDRSADQIASQLGQSCHAHHALPAILAVLLETENYVDAMKLNVMIGGDSATRAMIIGALLGARFGMQAIPVDWLNKLRDH